VLAAWRPNADQLERHGHVRDVGTRPCGRDRPACRDRYAASARPVVRSPNVPPRYDVAFTFLARDLAVAKDLADRLAPGLKTFVYDRQKEELLGGDGMERFAQVFRHNARLAVILHHGASADKPAGARRRGRPSRRRTSRAARWRRG
jgi:hypothetical protein